ncbi:MAG: FAD:protein FMN transferase [Deltaproteobacteria bacterium]|nr:FAD:protein FMN transferase [Deltaproteobacteria bacterium]
MEGIIRRIPLAVTALIFLSALIFASFAQAGLFTKKTSIMGTDLEMTVSASEASSADAAFSSVEEEMARIEALMSEWMDGTPVSEVNRSAGIGPVAVPDEVFKIITDAVLISEASGGAFDVTWASMRGLWLFTPGNERLPSKDEVDGRLGLVDYRNIVLDPAKKTVYLKMRGMAIGLGAIAKGYAVDRAMKQIASSGIKDAIVKAGGDMRVQGRGPDGGSWKIGIRDPRDKDRLIATLEVSNVSISTSGDYERSFIKDGVLYHHIMDPKTGYPARGTRSVTILGPDTETTDALSTAVFVLGPEAGMGLIKSLKGVEALIVDSNGRIHSSPGISLGATVAPERP